jgi:hypothetical protein
VVVGGGKEGGSKKIAENEDTKRESMRKGNIKIIEITNKCPNFKQFSRNNISNIKMNQIKKRCCTCS